MKKTMKKRLYNFISSGGMTVVIAVTVILCALVAACVKGESAHFMDWTIFTSIIVAMLLEIVSGFFSKWLLNLLEDDAKLTTDYEWLSNKYADEQIKYNNAMADEENVAVMRQLTDAGDKKFNLVVKIPVICEHELKNCRIEIKDSHKQYLLPDVVVEHFDEIFAVHATSVVYNRINIRVDSWGIKEPGVFEIKTSRTTYVDSMVTNRAMDYQWKNGLSVREMYECGAYIHSLEESRLSNHIGFNGFVESSDGYVVFVKRKGFLSVGKRTYGNSLGASLKTKYALDADGNFTEEGLKKGILYELADELKIPLDQLEEFSPEKNIIAAYRDLVEGGKPQFLVVLRSKWVKQEIQINFENQVKGSGKKDTTEDGSELLWVAKSDLKKMCILPNAMIHEGKAYPMMPSATASLVLYMNSLE